MVVVPARQATYAGKIDSFESILALLKGIDRSLVLRGESRLI
jgi:hypothetical protein